MEKKKMTPISEFLDELLDTCGGFGRFQFFIMFVVLGGMSSVTFSMMMMTFAGATPDWNCVRDDSFVRHDITPATTVSNESLHVNGTSMVKQCFPAWDNETTTACEAFTFNTSMNTVVNQWDLVCDEAWIPSTITTIQMSGVLLGGLFTGHLADKIGRKPTHFLSMLTLLVFNVLCGFSVSWEMFATCRLFIGLGIGAFLTVYYPYVLEFIPNERRVVLPAFPMWGIWSALFALVAWGLPDWRYLHFVSAACAAPWLLTWRLMPESFRWLISNNKQEAAFDVIQRVAKFNGSPIRDIKALKIRMDTDVDEPSTNKVYTIRDMFSTAKLAKMTFLHIVSWLACGYGYYGISFGVKGLTGNLFLNMALLSIAEIPAIVTLYFFTNRLGRKWTSLLFCGIGIFAAVTVAFIEATDLQNKVYRTVFVLISKIGVSLAWLGIKLLATELFPTVIRSVSSGLFNSMARVGSLIAPQMVYLNDDIPGILYFICSGGLILAFICICFMPETNNRMLPDTLHEFGSNKLKPKKYHPYKLFDMTTTTKKEKGNIIFVTHM
ncbi:solute carrier family 22 member 4-like [Mizuhopecten yessoensis]|uniref:solute carrier family 22 member 4-like n=1 Tax=Mizuhopecten yessoensis TaxID=6573 RepID=UPI000B45A9C8|nr:solute carrier family 22 member 4-like [Mizuhopecten yessoensis]